MNPAQFHCPLCTSIFEADAALAGEAVTCPTCNGVVTLPVAAAGLDYDVPPPPPPPNWDHGPPPPPDALPPPPPSTWGDETPPPVPVPPTTNDDLPPSIDRSPPAPPDVLPPAAFWPSSAAVAPTSELFSPAATTAAAVASREALGDAAPAASTDETAVDAARPLPLPPADTDRAFAPQLGDAATKVRPTGKTIRRLHPAEKARRRKRRSIAMMVFGLLMLLATMFMIARLKP